MPHRKLFLFSALTKTFRLHLLFSLIFIIMSRKWVCCFLDSFKILFGLSFYVLRLVPS